MPRKAFVADLQQAILTLPSEKLTDLKAGDDDGTFVFTYKLSGNRVSLTVNACISGILHPIQPKQGTYSTHHLH